MDALQWDDADLAALSTPTPADQKAAASRWESDAPKWAALLLTLFTFDVFTQRYTSPAGIVVPETTIRQAVDVVAQRGGARLAALTAQLQAGALDVPTWQVQMAQELRTLHLAMAAAGQGGWAYLAPVDFDAVAAKIQVQLGFLQGWAEQLAAGTAPLDGRALARAQLYGSASRGTYEATRREQQALRGGQERRLLHAAESCPDCEGYAGQGWVSIGTLPGIGEASVCRSNCRCSFAYRVAVRVAA